MKMTDAEFEEMQQMLAIVSDKLKPHLIALTPAERQQLPKMSDGSIPFVKKSLEYAQTNPALVPPYLDVKELNTDVTAVELLVQIFRPIEQLYFNLNDTITLSGSEAYVTSLAFYHSVKQAAKMNVPNAKAIAEDMKPRFAGQGKQRGKDDGGATTPVI
jgi:hypothetical protein